MSKKAGGDSYITSGNTIVCPFPFTQLFLDPSGIVQTCCWHSQYHLGDIKKQSLEEIWNGENARKLRREFIDGNPQACKTYIEHHGCNKFPGYLNKYVQLTEEVPFPPKRIDVRLNGKCNLECIMCEVWKQENGVYNEERFWKDAKNKIFPYINEINVTGGETFIQKDTYRLIDEISEVNPECKWMFVTNGHYAFNDYIRSKLNRIVIRHIDVSIDSIVPETFAKIRLKGQLSKVLDTFHKLREYSQSRPQGRQFPIFVNFVFQRENAFELPQMVAFCRKYETPLYVAVATVPESCTVTNISESLRRRILLFYMDVLEREKDPVYVRVIRTILPTLSGNIVSAVKQRLLALDIEGRSLETVASGGTV